MNKFKELFQKNKEVILYLVFGVLTTLVNYVVYALCRELLQLPLLLANSIAWVLAVLFAFATNRKYVFTSEDENILKELGLFVGARVLSFLLFDQLTLYLMVKVLGINEYIAKLIANVFVIVFNYVASKLLIFKNKKK